MAEGIAGVSVDAAEVGLALAFPGRLRGALGAMAASWGPVEAAVARGWAGLERLRVMTATANRSVARPRVVGLARLPGRVDGADGGKARVEAPGPVDVREMGAVAGAARAMGSLAPERGDAAGGRDRGGLGTQGDVLRGAAGVADVTGAGGGGGLSDGGAAPGGRERAVEAASGGATARASRGVAPVVVRVSRAVVGPGAVMAGPGGGFAEADVAEPAVPSSPGAGIAAAPGWRADVRSALAVRAAVRALAGGEGVGGRWADLADGAATGDAPGGPGWAAGADGRDAGWRGPGVGAAPRAEREDGGERLLGDIVLDGHLVGQWMSDRMARDASRPGAGTTGFDPRQSPAWVPSGAA